MSKQFNWKKDRCWFYHAMLKEKFYKYLKRKKMWELKTVQVCLFHFVSMLYEECPWWSFSGPYFLVFGLNMESYSVSLCIYSKCGKIRTRNTLNTDNVHPVQCTHLFQCFQVFHRKCFRMWPLVTTSVILESLLLNLNRFHILWSQINRRS